MQVVRLGAAPCACKLQSASDHDVVWSLCALISHEVHVPMARTECTAGSIAREAGHPVQRGHGLSGRIPDPLLCLDAGRCKTSAQAQPGAKLLLKRSRHFSHGHATASFIGPSRERQSPGLRWPRSHGEGAHRGYRLLRLGHARLCHAPAWSASEAIVSR